MKKPRVCTFLLYLVLFVMFFLINGVCDFPFFFLSFGLCQVKEDVPQTQTKVKAIPLAQDASKKEEVSKEETKSDNKRGDSNQVYIDNPQEKKISQKSLPKIKKEKALRQTPIHYSHCFLPL